MERKKTFIGIDPGKSGFITLWKDNDFQFFPMPYHKVETGGVTKTGKPEMKSEFHEEGFRDLIYKIHKQTSGTELHVCIEQVIGREGWSANNNFNFGYVAGMQKMVAIMLGGKVLMVRPQKWQKIMYQGFEKVMKRSESGKTMVHDTKATSEIVAKALAPDIEFSKQGVKKKDGSSFKIDDNKTDSFLMCMYIKNQIKES